MKREREREKVDVCSLKCQFFLLLVLINIFDRLCIALIKTFQHLNNHTRCPGNPATPVSPFVDTYPWKKILISYLFE